MEDKRSLTTNELASWTTRMGLACVCLGENDVFAGTVHGRSGGLPECIGCKRVEDAILSADQMLPACRAFIADNAPSDIDGVFQAGRCIGLMQGLGYPSRLFGVCPPDEVTLAQRARVAVTYVEARPERMHEDFRALAVEAMQKAWLCKGWKGAFIAE